MKSKIDSLIEKDFYVLLLKNKRNFCEASEAINSFSAAGGTRTHTGLLLYDFESYA